MEKKNYIRNVFVSISNFTSINIINANKQKKKKINISHSHHSLIRNTLIARLRTRWLKPGVTEESQYISAGASFFLSLSVSFCPIHL